MGKRFTATEKWDNPWYRKLPPVYKCFWHFLLDKCDIAGVWRVDFEGASFAVGETIDQGKAVALMGDNIMAFDGGKKWWIRQFIDYQYGAISPDTKSKPQQNVLTCVRLHDLEQFFYRVSKGYPDSIHTVKTRQEKTRQDKKEKNMIDIEQIIDAWCELHPTKRRPKKTEGRQGAYAKIAARLAAGRTVAEIIKGIKGNAADEWHRSKSKHELSYVCQSCDRLDQMMAKCSTPLDDETTRKQRYAWLRLMDMLRNRPESVGFAEAKLGPISDVTEASTVDVLDAWLGALEEATDA